MKGDFFTMLIHGGDITGFEERYGTIPLDFSVNSNPFGLSPKAEAALHSAAKRACQYPDPLYRRLRLAIAKHEALSPEWIFCGNGAADLIWRIVYAVRPRHALLMAPTFLEYDKALTCVHCHVEHYLLREREDFQPGEDFLDRITEKTDILFLLPCPVRHRYRWLCCPYSLCFLLHDLIYHMLLWYTRHLHDSF